MKVKKLIKYLKKCNPKADVVLERERGCTYFSPCDAVKDDAVYVPNNNSSGIVYDESYFATNEDWENWKRVHDRKKCVVLVPIN